MPHPEQELAAARQELEHARRTLDEMQRLARLGTWERDLRTGESIWSDEMFRIHGFEPSSVFPSRETMEALTHPDDLSLRAMWFDAIDRHPGSEAEQVLRLILRSGEEITIRARGMLVVGADGTPERLIGTVQDITEEARGKEAQAALAQIVESSTEAIVTTDLDLRVKTWNRAAEQLYGYTAQEMIGRDFDVLIPPEFAAEHLSGRAARRSRLLSGESACEEYEARRMHKDGTVIHVCVRTSMMRDYSGKFVGLVTNVCDITDRRRAEERIRHLADHDALTGLINRHRFEEELAVAGARAEQLGHQAAVLMLDLDNFKYVNETYGHNTGDVLVTDLADALRSEIGATDVLARLGGDEFGVLSSPSDPERAEALATKLLGRVREHAMTVGEHTVTISASVGVATFGAIPSTPTELLADVDRAMYESKEAGRNRVTVYTDVERVNARRRMRSAGEHLIRDAIENDRFELFGQPIVNLTTGVASHIEILLRLRHDGRLILPGEFLPRAERLGLIHLVDHWVISHALRVAAQHPELTFDINLSGATIDDDRLEGFIANELRDSNADPSRIVFELTETAAIGNISRAQELAHSLSGLGCRFAIDDFGSGFSTFYYLKHLPAHYVKIDGEFTNGARDRMDALVIESIVRIARELGKETIAEYVSDAATLEHVRALGVDYGQGYHFGKPFPVTELATARRRLLPEQPRAGRPVLMVARSAAADG